MNVRGVVFDVGGVLERVDDAYWPGRWLSDWAERADVPIADVHAYLARHEPSGGVATGSVTEAQMRDLYASALGLSAGAADELMAEMWDHYCGSLNHEMHGFCASLRPRYRTAILTNSADGARREEQRRYGFAELVDVLVYSHEVGLAKPDPAIYRLTEERLGLAGPELVLVDDVPANVDAAVACGWAGVLHQTTASTIAQVRDLLAGRHAQGRLGAAQTSTGRRDGCVEQCEAPMGQQKAPDRLSS